MSAYIYKLIKPSKSVWMKIQVLNGTTNDFTNLALSMTGKIVKLTSVGQLTIGLE